MNKAITVYGIICDTEPETFLTITANIKQAREYTHKLIRLQNATHYINWCDCHHLAVDDDSWLIYFNTCVTEDEKTKYRVRKLKYRAKNICEIMRMFMGTVPLGCSYDSPVEYQFLAERLAQDPPDSELLKVVESNLPFMPKLQDSIGSSIKDAQ